ncbi:hypothetical protein ACSTS3_16410 [Aquimarina muelleri]
MTKTILNINGVQLLNKEILKQVNAGFRIERETGCSCNGNENNNPPCDMC